MIWEHFLTNQCTRNTSVNDGEQLVKMTCFHVVCFKSPTSDPAEIPTCDDVQENIGKSLATLMWGNNPNGCFEPYCLPHYMNHHSIDQNRDNRPHIWGSNSSIAETECKTHVKTPVEKRRLTGNPQYYMHSPILLHYWRMSVLTRYTSWIPINLAKIHESMLFFLIFIYFLQFWFYFVCVATNLNSDRALQYSNQGIMNGFI